MRILRVAQKVYPDVKGGGPYHVHAMSRDQAEMGHEVTVLTVNPDTNETHVEERDGYTVVRQPITARPLGNSISTGVASYLREINNFDVVHAHSHLYFSTNLAALRRWLGDTPLAITNHGLYSQNAPKWLFDIYLRTLGRWTFNQSDMIFCYTEEDRSRVEEFGVNSRIEVIANGVDTSRFTPEGSQSELIDHSGPVILFVGRLVEGKRPQDAIEAVSALSDDTNAKLYVVGDGPKRDELEEQANPEDVEFLGHVQYDEMPAVYRSGDVLLLPSIAEGLPRTVLEAFASGIPAVTSHLKHTASIVQEGGETVEVGDIRGYVDALENVLCRRDTFGRRGRDVVTTDFQWQKTVKETTRCLKSLV